MSVGAQQRWSTECAGGEVCVAVTAAYCVEPHENIQRKERGRIAAASDHTSMQEQQRPNVSHNRVFALANDILRGGCRIPAFCSERHC
jgi:hypothetical protein